MFYSCPIKRFANDTSGNIISASASNSKNEEAGSDTNDDGGNADANDGTTTSNTLNEENENVIAVVKFSHAGDALSLIRNWKYVQLKLNEQYKQQIEDKSKSESEKESGSKTESKSIQKCKMNAFLLYTDGPNAISLHPEKSKVDASMIESIWDLTNNVRDVKTDAGKVAQQADDNMITSLVDAYRLIEKRQYDLDRNAAAAEGSASAGVGATSASASETDAENNNGSTTSTTNASTIEEIKLKLDTAKVRAAAGGGNYDEETDPLNAPEVLAAVAEFKKRLEVTQGGHRKKRRAYVEKRLVGEVKKAKERLVKQRKEMEEEKKRQQEQVAQMAQQQQGLGPPPPLPPHMNLPPPPLPPGGVPPPPQPSGAGASGRSRDTGRRGVSNLPAWMTAGNDENGESKKRSADDMTNNNVGADNTSNSNTEEPQAKKKFVPSEANRDINARKERLVVDGSGGSGTSLAAIRAANEAADRARAEEEARKKKVLEYLDLASKFTKEQIMSGSFPKLHLPESIPLVRQFVKEQMVEYLGEEEATLIDFVMNYLVKSDADSKDSEGNFKGKKVDGLLEEMQMVLEEDAESFVVDLFKKIVEVCQA